MRVLGEASFTRPCEQGLYPVLFALAASGASQHGRSSPGSKLVDCMGKKMPQAQARKRLNWRAREMRTNPAPHSNFSKNEPGPLADPYDAAAQLKHLPIDDALD